MLQFHETLLAKLVADLQNTDVAAAPIIESEAAAPQCKIGSCAKETSGMAAPAGDKVSVLVASEVAVARVYHDITKSATGLVVSELRCGRSGFFTRLVRHPAFEALSIGLILCNTAAMAFSCQYVGFEIGYLLRYPGMGASAIDTWPSAGRVLDNVEYAFAIWYTLELCLKLLGFQLEFFKSWWNLLDVVLVMFWYLNELSDVFGAFNAMTFRLVRLCRLMRLVQHMGWFQAFDALHMLITAIVASFPVLVWSTLILFALLVAAALTSQNLLQDFFQDAEYTEAQRTAVYVYFGSFTRSFISMFEIAFASHALITRTVMENVSETWAVYFCAYKCVVSLSVLRVISGVFMHETFKVCSEDDELMIIQKRRAHATHVKKMKKLFQHVNSDADDGLSWPQFEAVLRDDWVNMWLSAMDIDVSNVERLWSLLDDGDGCLTADELVDGVTKLKGSAKSVDMLAHIREMDVLGSRVADIHTIVEGVAEIRDALGKMQLKNMQATSGMSREETNAATIPAIERELTVCAIDRELTVCAIDVTVCAIDDSDTAHAAPDEITI